MALTIYGQSGSRAVRALWMAEELGLDFDHVPTTFTVDAKTPEFRAINPNGRIPTIVDDGQMIGESMAINLHLARKYGGELAPASAAEETDATYWSFWVMTEVEKTLLQAMFHATGFLGMEKSPELVAKNLALLEQPLGVLNDHLSDRDYLLGDRFTVADLNVSSIMLFAPGKSTFDAYPNVKAWTQRCHGRPALARAQARD